MLKLKKTEETLDVDSPIRNKSVKKKSEWLIFISPKPIKRAEMNIESISTWEPTSAKTSNNGVLSAENSEKN